MTDSLSRRFAATLATNAVGAAVSFAASLVAARALGPAAFGDYAFLLASFAALNTWLDLGTPTAFFTFASKGVHVRPHLRLYAAWLAARFAAVAATLAFLPEALLARAWVGQPRALVLAAWCAFFASVVGRVFLVQLAESARRTFFAQGALAALSLAHLALVAALAAAHRLSPAALFGLLAVEYAALGAWYWLRFDPAWLGPDEPGPGAAALIRRYAGFCAPLVGYAFLGFLAEYADRWLLQRFGGAPEQGYYALGQQFSAVALLATTSLLNIFWKELAAAEAGGDRARIADLYGRASRAVFFTAAAAGAFLAPHAPALLAASAGPRYADAWPTLALLLTYPAFQSLGQLNGAFFFATEDTKTHVSVSAAAMAVGLPLSWLVLAPADAPVPGLGLGAAGLAARAWLTQAAAVSLQCLIVSRRTGTPSGPAGHWGVLLALLALSAACAVPAQALFGRTLAAAAAAAVPFAAGAALLVRLRPGVAGLSAWSQWRALLPGPRRPML